MKINTLILLASAVIMPFSATAKETHSVDHAHVSDQVIAEQRHKLAMNTEGKGFGPQAPRDIDSAKGNNRVKFSAAPAYTEMNLCNIHFHKNAEHAGGEFTKYAGNGDGNGYQSGYTFSGDLTAAETAHIDKEICPSEHGGLSPGDTIEVHYVYSTARVKPGPTLASCLSEAINNPQLRVETQVFVLVNDQNAHDFNTLTQPGMAGDLHQAAGMLNDSGVPIQYAGSTTGPTYNEKGSPFQVTWSVRPKVAQVNIETVGEWCKGNVFDENHAHGVRNLVTNPDLLSKFE